MGLVAQIVFSVSIRLVIGACYYGWLMITSPRSEVTAPQQQA